MTDWHCPQCRRHARVYRHADSVRCGWCDRHMKRGRGRGTTLDRWHSLLTQQLAEDEAPGAGYVPRLRSPKRPPVT